MRKTLKNGARVLHYFSKGDEYLVLAEWDRGARLEFVTWRVDENGAAYSGHYFDHYREAMKDLLDRAAKLNLNESYI